MLEVDEEGTDEEEEQIEEEQILEVEGPVRLMVHTSPCHHTLFGVVGGFMWTICLVSVCS